MEMQDVNQTLMDNCSKVIGYVIGAEDILAKTLYQDARAYIGMHKVDRQLKKCHRKFSVAEDQMADDEFAKAVGQYRKAWQHAARALEYSDS